MEAIKGKPLKEKKKAFFWLRFTSTDLYIKNESAHTLLKPSLKNEFFHDPSSWYSHPCAVPSLHTVPGLALVIHKVRTNCWSIVSEIRAEETVQCQPGSTPCLRSLLWGRPAVLLWTARQKACVGEEVLSPAYGHKELQPPADGRMGELVSGSSISIKPAEDRAQADI